MSYVSLNLTYRHIISKSESLSKKGKIYRNFVYGLVVYHNDKILCRVLISREEEVEPRGLVVEVERPWYGLLGLYNHLDHQVAGRTVRWAWSEQLTRPHTPPLQTCSHLHVRTDWRPAGLSVRRARQDPNTRNAHRHHWLVRDGFNMFLLLKVWTQS